MNHLLPTQTTKDEHARDAHVAILPIGSFEQHGPYLPLSTDAAIASIIAREIAQLYPVRHLPPITISCSHEHKAWPGTVSISARTLFALIADIQASLRASGIDKLVLINAHGGNYVLSNVVQEATVTERCMALFPTNADWKAARAKAEMETTSHEDMHAGELEVSILLATNPELVRDGYDTVDHIADDRNDLLTVGMEAYTKTGVIGRPSLATADKGRTVLDHLGKAFRSCLRSIDVVV
ncbi:creatininase family protein [Nonomuraea jabiensis]|uniref:Creatinine amidohydrolase n=1 Tax=Nonomuraea jabiensis TaxID=882448 RepID=A0A7W9G7H2_9ACTN|nr:creatininase family protein [Nonomuraea jabiensis]MBB5778665.1 creatinine amidohydrolase [Nonomuraea jabiensis]